jgi:hypothetical protein
MTRAHDGGQKRKLGSLHIALETKQAQYLLEISIKKPLRSAST